MLFRVIGAYSLAAVLAVAVQGCKKSSSEDIAAGAAKPVKAEPLSPPGVTLARVHWLGKKRIAADNDSASVMAIWKLPESVRLEQQTLDKLALAPSLPPKGIQATNYQPFVETNASAKLLRPLAEDALQEECYFECGGPTNRAPDIVFGIRLEEGRAGLWRTNLGQALEVLTGLRTLPAPDGKSWSLRKHDRPNLIELTRAGGWTLVGLGQDKNELLPVVARRLQGNPDSLSGGGTSHWLESHLTVDQLAKALGVSCRFTDHIPLCSLFVHGEDGKVRTRGEIQLAGAAIPPIEPWDLPTNLVHEPLTSFIALQGLRPLLQSLDAWKQINPSHTGNQVFIWSDDGAPFLNYLAAPWPGASNDLVRIRHWWLDNHPRLVGTNFVGKFEALPMGTGIAWGAVPFMSPYLQAVTPNNRELIIGGLFANPGINPPSAGLLKEVFSRTNLLMYNWEISDPRIEQYFDILQLLRLAIRKPQLPTDSASVLWLKALNNHLGNAVTTASRSDANKIDLTRKSGVGLTAFELHLLGDWLESAAFPRSCFTMSGTNTPPAKKGKTPPGLPAPKSQAAPKPPN